MHITDKINNLVTSINTQFHNKAIVENLKKGRIPSVSLTTEITQKILWLHFTGTETLSITIPLPFIENDTVLVEVNEITRAICNHWVEDEQRELDFTTAIYNIVCSDATGLVSDSLTKSYPFLQQMIYAFENGNPAIIAHRFQRAINELVNKMPLHNSDLNSWVMNHRLVVIDPVFDDLTSPDACLKYQVAKAEKYFEKGWTAIGLSDGSLANKNYILTTDLRRLSPFGLKYHNPQRNLYSTLDMEGDELPIVRSQSMQDLMDKGVTRTGWNMFTLFADVPDVFEDQILVDKVHVDKFVTHTKRFHIFGMLTVKVGDIIKSGDRLGILPDGTSKIFTVVCDRAKVVTTSESITEVGNRKTQVYNVVVECVHYFKDGLKLTNLHGNKGIIRLMDLGYAIDPRTGKERKIDVIVGAKTIGKRKNYGQVMEALTNGLVEADDWTVPENPVVLADDCSVEIDNLKSKLDKRGLGDGTWHCDTPYGRLYGVCGRVFWGCIKIPENQTWRRSDTTVRDSKDIRRSGLKFSHVEIRALKTRLGDNNPVIDEIMGYAQGADNLRELLHMTATRFGILPEGKQTVDINAVNSLDQSFGIMVPGQYIDSTVVDEFFQPNGFLLKLPIPYQTVIDEDGDIIYKGGVQEEIPPAGVKTFIIDKIYIPNGILRKCWLHDSGQYGLSDIGTIVNNVVSMAQRTSGNQRTELSEKLYFNHLHKFFKQLTRMIGNKRGQLSNLGMAIRYPLSSKSVAALSTTLPKNTVEIHRSMADQLHVVNGDIVVAIRFPCLGFMSVRLQQIRVTDDIMCKYTIRVSNNNLVSQNLDFDGDNIYIASFHTPEAKDALKKEWTNPNATCYKEIKQLNERKGAPHVKCYTLDDYKIKQFDALTKETHSTIVEKNTGIKAQTGPVIALTYNLMRILENSDMKQSQKLMVGMEMFLEKAAQSVFEQKHGGQSLHEIVIDCICTGDIEGLVSKGFKRGITTKLINIIKEKAKSLGVTDLVWYHKKNKDKSNIISTIVRKQNRIYFASRSCLDSFALIKALNEPAVDIPSKIFKQTMSGKTNSGITKLEELDLENSFSNDCYKQGCQSILEGLFNTPPPHRLVDAHGRRCMYVKTVGHRN